MKISILCPTRKRPSNIQRVIKTAFETAYDPDKVEMIMFIDNEDTESKEMFDSDYVSDQIRRVPDEITTARHYNLSQMWNECWKIAKGEIFMHCGDDIIFQSKNWDKYVRDAFEEVPDKILLVHGRDGGNDANLGTHSFIHKNWTNTLHFFVPPYFEFWYNDTWLNELADRIGRRKYIPEIYTQHLHCKRAGHEPDETYTRRSLYRKEVQKIWKHLGVVRIEDAKKLDNFIKGFNSGDI